MCCLVSVPRRPSDRRRSVGLELTSGPHSFDEITTYCCTAVGGTVASNTITPIGSTSRRRRSSSSSSSSLQARSEALTFPICQTTNYNDMLRCYDLIAGDHCKDHNIFPVGICNANSQDTSGLYDESNSGGSGSGTSAQAASTAVRGQTNGAVGGVKGSVEWRVGKTAVWTVGSVLASTGLAAVLSI